MHDPHPTAAESIRGHTPTDLLLARIRAAQQLTPEQRILAGIEQSELAISIVRDGIRDQHPEADAATLERLLCERIEMMRKFERPIRSSPIRSDPATLRSVIQPVVDARYHRDRRDWAIGRILLKRKYSEPERLP